MLNIPTWFPTCKIYVSLAYSCYRSDMNTQGRYLMVSSFQLAPCVVKNSYLDQDMCGTTTQTIRLYDETLYQPMNECFVSTSFNHLWMNRCLSPMNESEQLLLWTAKSKAIFLVDLFECHVAMNKLQATELVKEHLLLFALFGKPCACWHYSWSFIWIIITSHREWVCTETKNVFELLLVEERWI